MRAPVLCSPSLQRNTVCSMAVAADTRAGSVHRVAVAIDLSLGCMVSSHYRHSLVMTANSCICRFLARPYGRVDRPKLKRTLLERCVAAGGPQRQQGSVLQPTQQQIKNRVSSKEQLAHPTIDSTFSSKMVLFTAAGLFRDQGAYH